ncbi:MAG: translation initiation factor IF-2 [Desulfomonile tiedjei]|nr:translation initiation factor IF-2 [Desulfomonile tiedjei]
MTMLTVDDLARDLKVRNEDLLRELVTMGFEVEGPESPLETDDPAALRAQLVTVLPQREVVEQRIKPTVIRRRMKKPPAGFESQEAAEQLFPPETEAQAGPIPAEQELFEPEAEPRSKEAAKAHPKKTRKPEAARIIEMAPKPVPPARAEKPAPGGAPARDRSRVKGEALRAIPSPEEPQPIAAPPGAPGVEEGEHLGVTAAAETQLEPSGSPTAAEAPGEGELSAAEEAADEDKKTGDKAARKKKKKEKRIQPAQIIGRVELKKEPPRETVQPEPVVVPFPSPPRPAPVVPHGPAAHAPAAPLVGDAALEEEKRKRAKKKDKKGREEPEAVFDEEANKLRRRKEVILRDALYDDRPGRGRLRGKGKKPKPRKTEITQPKAIKRRVKLPETVTVAHLAHRMSVKGTAVIRHLLGMGQTASLNEPIDFETATLVASEFGFEVESVELSEKDLLPAIIQDTEENLVYRSPVVTVMGHVDHGKTSLLDAIRSTRVTDTEAGGITQHIGAYKVPVPDKGEVVFLDTPGHEAFTAMRARGAQVTDFVVLVVAADDGVMDQTREAINHSRAANVPIIVAVNKIDKPEADRDRVVREVSEQGLIPEAWGGDTIFAYVSAKTGAGIPELLDLILLQAEMMELRANPNKTAVGTVVEARLDRGKGPVGTVLVKEGTLKLGDPFVAGTHHGKVRAMLDHEGKVVEQAGPSTPVEVHGFSSVPEAGETFIVVEEDKIARQVSEQRQHKIREQEVAAIAATSVEDVLARMQAHDSQELNIILKGDVQGSVEAVKEAIMGIPSREIKANVIHSGVGAITDSDVMLASASHAVVIGFNVRTSPKTLQLAEQEHVDVRLYTIIYDVLEDVRKAMEGLLAPIEKETVVGRCEVIQTFSVAKVGLIAGCHVRSGKIERSNQVRLIRDDRVIHQGRIASMKRYKEDIKEALEGYECGISLENYRDIKLGDIIEAFVIEKESAKLV